MISSWTSAKSSLTDITTDGAKFQAGSGVTFSSDSIKIAGSCQKNGKNCIVLTTTSDEAKVTVKFSNANTASTPTLNVGSTGAKNIFHKGSQITTGDNKALLAGTVEFVYDGTQYHLIGNYIDTNTHTTYTSFTGKPTGNQTPSFGGTFTISQIS